MTRVPAQTWVTILGCCILWTAFGSQIVAGARKHDFLNLYTGASLALDGNFAQLYDPGVQLERERRFVPELGALGALCTAAFLRSPACAACTDTVPARLPGVAGDPDIVAHGVLMVGLPALGPRRADFWRSLPAHGAGHRARPGLRPDAADCGRVLLARGAR